MKPIIKEVTFGVCSNGNTKALLMSLSSVLNAQSVPRKISLRLEGEFPSFSEFYLEQLASWARLMGVDFTISIGSAKGVRAARDWQLNNCSTPYLWMGDDDVVYGYECLFQMVSAIDDIANRTDKANWGYIVGSKPDINNRRGYGDFSTKEYSTVDTHDYASYNQFYAGLRNTLRVNTCDTGNVLINVRQVLDAGINFSPFEESYNSGGEDTLFGLQCNKAQLLGFFCTTARCVHLEKPASNFNEFAARGEMLLRAAEQLGLDKSVLKTEFMPFLSCNKA